MYNIQHCTRETFQTHVLIHALVETPVKHPYCLYFIWLYYKIMEARKGRSLLTNHNQLYQYWKCYWRVHESMHRSDTTSFRNGTLFFPASSVSSTWRYTWKTILLPCNTANTRISAAVVDFQPVTLSWANFEVAESCSYSHTSIVSGI